ncbi:MAG: dipeptide/oligopeptide/nickel ABC transporter permease/ATP-binding protein [Spirochaetaceae bacterium]|jgi:peptide/nickel transport system permease protein|nr:dipeptide/oligopeptide/nickel ABC transporter permease/ATP-binding protein [Spirochaetaceae bacterium]
MRELPLFSHKPLIRIKKREGIFFTLPVSIFGGLLLLIVLACVFAPLIAPYGMAEQNLVDSLSGPSARHLLGADKMGRDLYTRLLYGGRVTLTSALGVVLLSALIGLPLGLFSGYSGGWFDGIVGRICDIVLSFPSLLLAFLFVAALGRGLGSAVAALGIVYVPMITRLVRSLTLVEKNMTYVEAARSIGFSPPHILFRHILPNCLPTVMVQLALDMAYAILDLAALSFIGLGVTPPTADWGAMLDEGRNFLLQNPLLALAPGTVIVVTVVALNIFCDGIQQYLDPNGRRLPSFDEDPAKPDPGALTANPLPGEQDPAKKVNPANPPNEILRIENLKADLLTTQGTVYALGGVDLGIRRGEIHGLVGESGCGKTVTAKVILALHDRKHSRISGSVRFGDREILGLGEREMRRIRGKRIAMIFQDPMTSLSPLIPVGRQLEEGMANHLPLSRAERRSRALSLLERVGLEPAAERAGQYPFELSGGMLQRVMIAQAIACGPELLIADEPTTALDVTIQAQILALIRELRRESSLGVLFITHSFGVVAELCDRVSVMYAGLVVETAPVAELLRAPAHPYSRALIDCLPRGRGGELPVIPGGPPRLYRRPAGCPFAPRCGRAGAMCGEMPVPRALNPEHWVLCRRPLEYGTVREEGRHGKP